MSQNSAIEWTDTTWNPVRGCVKVSPGCAHCYAETFAERWRGVKGHPYEQGFDLRLVPEKLTEPLTWKKPRRVFVNSMSDLFHDGVPDAFIDKALAVMALADRHTFQVLTKRADRMLAYMTDPNRPARLDEALLWAVGVSDISRQCFVQHSGVEGFPLPNVWLGVSVENQRFADERIPLLLQTPAAVRFISAEPLLGPVDLQRSDAIALTRCVSEGITIERGLDWVIVGGESGPNARPFHVEWAQQIVEQCREAGVPCFVKQLGARPYVGDDVWGFERYRECDDRPGYEAALRDKKGGDISEWPEGLRVREFPTR